jgi:hypothetical protein
LITALKRVQIVVTVLVSTMPPGRSQQGQGRVRKKTLSQRQMRLMMLKQARFLIQNVIERESDSLDVKLVRARRDNDLEKELEKEMLEGPNDTETSFGHADELGGPLEDEDDEYNWNSEANEEERDLDFIRAVLDQVDHDLQKTRQTRYVATRTSPAIQKQRTLVYRYHFSTECREIFHMSYHTLEMLIGLLSDI